MKKSKINTIIIISCTVLLIAGAAIALFLTLDAKREALAVYDNEVRVELSALGQLNIEGLVVDPYETTFTVKGEYGEREITSSDLSAEVKVIVKTLAPTISASNFDPGILSIAITRDGQPVFSGTYEEFCAFVPPESGVYRFEATAAVETDDRTGSFKYRFSIAYDAEPVFTLSDTTVMQGDTLVLYGSNIRGGVNVSVDYDYEPFVVVTGVSCKGYIPINHVIAAGDYTVAVQCGGLDYYLPFTVEEREFEVQHLTVSTETTSATIDNSAANAEYAAVMYPLFDSFDPNIYWEGGFIEPVVGYSVTTEYGIKRYVNDATYPTRHAGVDMACAEGTPIVAPNNGKVLFSGYLQLSGNTIVIEHGMGLHSVYLHMSALSCDAGDMVRKGDVIGNVGTTGFSTGPHLHFQLMIGGQSISPWLAFDGSGGLYGIA